jgi:RNA polymerase sigma-70 factor (ECF subfamily)
VRSNSRRPRSGADELPDLLPRLLAGDEATFTRVVTRWHPGLLRLATAITGNPSIGEEVVQDAWASALRSLHTFEGRASLRTWVHRICAHLALARTRQEGRSPLAADPAVLDLGSFDEARAWRAPPERWLDETPETVAARREVLACIERTLVGLPLRQRAVITLRDVQGFSAEEASEILGISDVHQRVLLHRARTRVRAACDHYYRELR